MTSRTCEQLAASATENEKATTLASHRDSGQSFCASLSRHRFLSREALHHIASPHQRSLFLHLIFYSAHRILVTHGRH